MNDISYTLPFIDKTNSSLTSIHKLYRNFLSISTSLEKSLSLLSLSSRDTFVSNIISIETSFATMYTLLEELDHEISNVNDSSIDKLKQMISDIGTRYDIISDKFSREARRYKAFIKKEKELNNKLYMGTYAHAIMLTSECLSEEDVNDSGEDKKWRKRSCDKEIQNVNNFINGMKKLVMKLQKIVANVDNVSSCLTQCTGTIISEDSKGNNGNGGYLYVGNDNGGLDRLNGNGFKFVDFMCGIAVIATLLFVFYVMYKAI